ncbi:MAG: hypothetical protein KBD19_01915 [Candidatus Moranbacteria bacterium]|nr:hypothetical protein [Candidatus Moranbacteria bacterium]
MKNIITITLVFFVGVFALQCPDVFAISALADCPNGGAGYTLVSGVCVPSTASTGLSAASPGSIIVKVVNWLMGIIGIIAILMFIVSGWMYLTAAGDEKKTETAKSNITYTIIGVAVALTAFIIVRLVANLMGVNAAGVGAVI